MRKVYTPEKTVTDRPLPDVYIESIDVFGNGSSTSYKIKYIISGESTEWIHNDYLLDNVYLNILINGDQHTKVSLRSIEKHIDGDKISGTVAGKSTDPNYTILTISAYCSNEYITGTATSEIMNDLPISFQGVNFSYISKLKDFRILNFNTEISSNPLNNTFPKTKKSYVSYNKSKKANVGFILDLKDFFLSKSDIFKKIFHNNKVFFRELAKVLTLTPDNIRIYKKEKSFAGQDYQLINSTVDIKKMSTLSEDLKYIVSLTDDNSDIFNYKQYELRVDLRIEDKIVLFIKSYLLEKIQSSKNFINYYKSSLQDYKKNNLIEDYKKYFFENNYDSFFNNSYANLYNTLNNLIYVFSIITQKDIKKVAKFFTSAFHPLITSDEYIDIILQELSNVENYIYSFISDDSIKNDILTNNLGMKFYESTFYLDHPIDYNYEYDYGCDIVIQQKYDKGTKERYNGIKKLSIQQYNNRKSAEAEKYVGNTINPENIKYLTISTIMSGDISAHLLSTDFDNIDTIYKNIFYKLKSKKTRNKLYNEQQTFYEQILENNISIKQISEGVSTTKSNFFKNILFDADINSKTESERAVSLIQLDKFYSLFINEKYINIEEFIKTYLQSNTSVTFKNITIKEETIDYKNSNNIIYLIMLYNNFFIEKVVESGENYDLYSLEPAIVNDVFTKNLKIFNQYFIIEKNTAYRDNGIAVPNVLEELQNYSIPPIYFNRLVTKHVINNILEDI